MWEAIDDDEELLEAPIKTMSWPIESPVSSTLLDTQQLEELEFGYNRRIQVMALCQGRDCIMS
jgi:hypothetical protein